MIVYEPPRAADHIPLIDLSGSVDDPDVRECVAWEIHKAARETGFFYVAGHGVPQALMDAQIAAARAFFAQPSEAKQAVHISRSPCRRGYEGEGAQVLDAGSPADLKESFALARDLGPDHPHVVAKLPMQGANLWPDGLPGFREQMTAYEAEMIRLGTHLLGTLAMSIDLPPDFFADGLAEPQCGIRLLRYPPQPAETDDNRLGAGAHSDWGSITICCRTTCRAWRCATPTATGSSRRRSRAAS